MAEVCPSCNRPLPKERSDSPSRRKRFSVAVPEGEEGVLDELLIEIVERYESAVPEFKEIGTPGWKYPPLAWALYHVVTLDLKPSEEGA